MRVTGIGRAAGAALAALSLVALGCEAGTAAAQTPSVAMVTDVVGTARVRAEAEPLGLLAELPSGAVVELDPGGRLAMVYIASGEEFEFRGPARIEVRPNVAAALAGAPARRSPTFASGRPELRIKPTGLVQAALVMRGLREAGVPPLRLIGPVNTKLLRPTPVFRWQPTEAGPSFTFELMDESGRSIHAAETIATSLELPAAIRLAVNLTYTWEVATRLLSGKRLTAVAEFSVVDEARRAEVERLRPPANAPAATRVLFAAYLENANLVEEARLYWKALARERPGDHILQALTGE
ncbi:MAG: hypothetical protein ACT4P2_03800 [Pseudomonadota bacterium]